VVMCIMRMIEIIPRELCLDCGFAYIVFVIRAKDLTRTEWAHEK